MKNLLKEKKISKTISFFSPVIRKEKVLNNVIKKSIHDDGFTLVELIVVVMMIGILSSIAIPQFMSAAVKAKQKEASAIVASLVKSATAYNTEYGALPRDMGELSEYAMFQRCDHNDVASEGGSVCKGSTPKKVPENVTQFFSTSGHYNINLRRTNGDSVFKVRALPNGGAYAQNGSGVTGCYNPAQGVSQVKEMTSKSTGKGIGNVPDWPAIQCGTGSDGA